VNPARELEKVAIGIVRRHVGDRGVVLDLSSGHEPDFRIDYRDGRCAIGEVGWHEDQHWRAIWEATLKRGEIPQVVELPTGSGLWSVGLTLDARIWRIYKQLPQLIVDLVGSGASNLDIYETWPPGDFADRARDLGIKHLSQVEGDSDRAIFFPPGSGGVVPTDPDAITDWLDTVLVSDVAYRDTTRKVLERAADERHVFLLAGSATPWGVEERLRRLDVSLPSRAPSVPSNITHVWAVSSFRTRLGVLWERNRGWSTFEAHW
jgi:hypothetical protein